MKQTRLNLKWTGPAGSVTALALLASLTVFCPSSLAKGKPGGGGGGGDGGNGVTVNPVPVLVPAPIGYTETEIPWNGDINENGLADEKEAGFGGVTFNGINNLGLAIAFIVGPHPTDPNSLGRRIGAINFDPDSGTVSDQFFDLNDVFAPALNALNEGLEDPWRIAYARDLSDGGLIAMQLIPDSAPRLLDAPRIQVVADLELRTSPDAFMVIPRDPGGDDRIYQLTEDGHVLVFDVQPEPDDQFYRLFPLGQDQSGAWGYFLENEIPLPNPLYWFYSPTIGDGVNFLPELLYSGHETSGTNSLSQLVRYTYSEELGGLEEVLHERVNTSFLARGFGTAGTAYGTAVEREKVGKGRNAETISYNTPYHIISYTERTPLANPMENADIPCADLSISDARMQGEEEVLIELADTGELLIYKPNFGARFALPIEPGTHRLVEISSPVDPLAVTTGVNDYAAGYVGYGTDAEPDHVIILTPDGAPIPGQ